MRLLALQAVRRQAQYLLGRYQNMPAAFWCKDRLGANVSLLFEDLAYLPEIATVELKPVWKEPTL